MEDHYVQRIGRLPQSTQRLMLLGATDAVGDAATIWRAATALGIGMDAAVPAGEEQLFEIGTVVRFHHPLVRSAVYRSASAADVRAAHKALADATDPVADPDRRAWHRAHATEGPDTEVADELERGADRAQARGGLVAAAALLERSASLTPDPAMRVERRCAAARCNLRAGAFDTARGLLAAADAETSDEFVRARIEMLRGSIAAASDKGGGASLLLKEAAKRFETLDPAFAHHTYGDAWAAAMWAGHLASPGGDVVEVSRAFLAAPWPPVPRRPFGLIHDGLARLVAESCAAAEPFIREGLLALPTADIPADNRLRFGPMAQVAAASIWDFDAWADVSEQSVKLARELGALAVLPRPLNGLALIAILRGDCALAAALAAEEAAIQQATGTRPVPYGAMVLAAYQGRIEEATARIVAMTEDSTNRGEGLGVDLARWAAAILNNGTGRYEEALATASPSDADLPGVLVSTWMLSERIEAATRCGRTDDAKSALQRFERDANTGHSDWRLGIEARLRAMLSDGNDAECWYRDSIACLGRTAIRAELGRSHLVFGEWLRREGRRIDARQELHAALDIFLTMSARGFAERARRELLATGAHVRSRRDDTRTDLTPQEEQVARLARDGRTNPEIAAELFISARTVEWHLSKVFGKLGITSRRGLKDALASRAPNDPRS
jgi:DNA-binding CsgD family transcriptional regulator